MSDHKYENLSLYSWKNINHYTGKKSLRSLFLFRSIINDEDKSMLLLIGHFPSL